MDGKKVLFIDNTGYLKSLDLDNFEINTIVKHSNVIKDYGSRYVLGRHSFTSFEMNGETTITSFESTRFYENLKYYLVEYNGIFEDFRVITALKKGLPSRKEKNLRENRDILMDYYGFLRSARIFSVDWKRKTIYCIPDIEKPEIERVYFDGEMDGKYNIDINAKKFKIERDEFDSYCEWFLANDSFEFKSRFKYTCLIPPYAPALQGIKVIGDWLLVITGKRNWERDENEVLVFGLPSLHYEGSFYIPFPHAPTLRTLWNGDYYITYNLEEEGDDYVSRHTVYRIDK